MSTDKHNDSPRVAIPPPLIVAGFIALGMVLDKYFETGLLLAKPYIGKIGAFLVAIAAGLVIWTMLKYAHYKTNIMPYAPDQALIKDGPFRFSRNPIYLAFLISHLGVALIVNAPITLAMVIGSYIVLRYYVIAREEAYLERKFGPPYLNLKRSVRRWI